MSFPRYPAYKPSGVEWLGEVPEHWSIQRFKLSVESCVNGVWGEEPGNGENDVICMRVADFDRQKLMAAEPDDPTIRSVSARDIAQRSLCNGDLLVEKSGGGEKQTVGAVVLYKGSTPAVCSNFVARMRLAQGMHPSFWRYAHHAAYSLKVNTKSIKQTSGIQNLDQQQYLDERAPYPPGEEQISIAIFLDRETAKIDALIAEQQRLIELLQEKRQSVISHAVTKGLNPDAPMKDSGVEWLGEVPEHWSILPVWMLFFLGRGRVISHEDIAISPGDYPVYSSQTERDGEMGKIDTFDFEGDYLTWTTDGANAGSVFQRSGRFNCTNVCGTLRAKSSTRVLLDFALQSLRLATSAFVRMDINPKLMNNVMASIKIPIPPVLEQQEIARHIRQKTERFKPLETSIALQLSLLKERRSALISAAVTGQIDARGLVPEASVA